MVAPAEAGAAVQSAASPSPAIPSSAGMTDMTAGALIPYSEKLSPRYSRRTFSSATSASGLPVNSTRPS